MPNPNVLTTDTVLYCAAEPEGRLFPTGETWPGDMWSSKVGGEPVGKASTASVLKDLIAAQDQIEALSARVMANAHDMALVGQAKDAAIALVADLEQRALAAEALVKGAEEAATNYMRERDAARDATAKAVADLAAAESLTAEANSKSAEVVASLEAANQTIADLSDKLAGGKPSKTTKTDAEAPADAQQAA